MIDCSSLVKKLKPCTFRFNGRKRKTFGVIAQDVLEVLPKEEYTICETDKNGRYTVDYEQFIPILIKMVQDIEERLRRLEER